MLASHCGLQVAPFLRSSAGGSHAVLKGRNQDQKQQTQSLKPRGMFNVHEGQFYRRTWRKHLPPFGHRNWQSVQSSVQSLSRVRLCDPMDCSRPGFPVLHQLPKLAQTHVHPVSDAIQPSHPLSSPSLPAFSLSQYQSLFQWVGSSHQVAKVLEFQLQHQSFQWISS